MPDHLNLVEFIEDHSFGGSRSESLEDMTNDSRISFPVDAGDEISSSHDQDQPTPHQSSAGSTSARSEQSSSARRSSSVPGSPVRRPEIPLQSPQGQQPQSSASSSSSAWPNASGNISSSNNASTTSNQVPAVAGIGATGFAPVGSRPNNRPNINNNVFDLSVEVLLNLTTCGICLEIFRDPKSLPCLHSFCKQCLMTLTQNDNTLPFPCPTCRRLCGSNVATLPDDFKSKLLVDTMRQRDRERQQSGRRSVLDAVTGSQPKSSQPVLCQIHGSRRCEFYCDQCNIPICVKCTTSDHIHHRFIDLFEDTQKLIDQMEEITENVKRDVQRLEENNTDIEIMLCEFSYLLDERVKKLKKLVDQTANQVKGLYTQELLSAQSDIRRQIIVHLNFIQKTNEYLASLRESVRDCAMFDVYADAKMHMNSSKTSTQQYLLQRPAKFEFAPCVEFQIINTLNQFFEQPGPVQPAISVLGQLGLQQPPATGGAEPSCPPPPGLSPPIAGARGNVVEHLVLGANGPPANGAIGGARRKRPIPSIHSYSSRRASPAVEALFSSAANATSSSSPLHFVEPPISTSQSAQGAGNYASDQVNESSSGGISILRSILPQTAITLNHSDGTRGATVAHPLTPVFLSSVRVESFADPNPPFAVTSSSRRPSSGIATFRPHPADRTNEVQVPLIDLVANNRNVVNRPQNVMPPQEVQQFFQNLLGSESRQTSQESVNLVPTQEIPMQSGSETHLNRGATSEVISMFPDMSISSYSADEQNMNDDQTSDDEASQDGPGSSFDIAEETL